MVAKSRTAFYEKEHVTVRRKIVVEKLDRNMALPLPGNAYLNGDVYFVNKKNVAVNGITIGTAAAGTQVLAATNVGASATVAAPATRSISRADRTLYVEAASWPAGADIGLVIEYTEVPFDRNIT